MSNTEELNGTNVETHIEREVQRRVSVFRGQQVSEVQELRQIIDACRQDLIRQNALISKMTSDPLSFGTLIRVNTHTAKECFSLNDQVIVTDPQSVYYQKAGVIIGDPSNLIDEQGTVLVKLLDQSEARFGIGLEGKARAQINLTDKSDGTSAIVNADGKFWEVRGVPNLNLKSGDFVKIRADNKAIVAKADDIAVGPIASVSAITDYGVEVKFRSENIIVTNPKEISLEEGDRVSIDTNLNLIVKKLPEDNSKRYSLVTEPTCSWDDIGGLEDIKQELKDAIELPMQKSDIFEYYKVKPMRGGLLCGPPGCGKTMLARACASSLASMHGKEVLPTGFIFVKAPEILNMYVGNTEAEVRNLFARSRKHYRKFGSKALLVFDEAEAILGPRGVRRSSDITDTVVPMFLGEMDGVDEQQTIENPIVLLLTNRPESLDQAVIRHRRINRHWKIGRPNEFTASNIMKLYFHNIPLDKEDASEQYMMITLADLFSKQRLLYRVNNEHDFTLGDCVNGAMIEEIVEMAKMSALHRDLKHSTKTGINLNDLRQAVEKIHRQQASVYHELDLKDFAEKLKIEPTSMQIQRRFGSA
jgi:proteasome-associated ATPase